MIDLKDIKLSDFKIIDGSQKPLKDRVFIPFFRVKNAKKKSEKYKVTKMPKEWYELFHKEF